MIASGFGPVVPLLRGRARMLVNTAIHGGRDRRGWTVIIAVAVAGTMVGSYRFAGVVLGIGEPPAGGLEALIAGGLLLLCGFTAVTSITFALSSLYFARDLDTLLSAPIAARSILLGRVLGQLALGAGIGTLIGGPPLIAYAVHEHALLALPIIFVAVVSLVTVPLVGGTVLTIVSVRLMPARYVRDAGGLVVTVVVFGVTAINLLLRGADTFTSGRAGVLDFSHYGRGPADAPWMPTGWAARAVVSAIDGRYWPAMLWASPLVAAAAALPILAAWACERPFVAGVQRNAAASRGRVRTPRAGAPGARRAPQWGWLVVMVKDLREIRRDASQLGQLLLPLVLFGFYLARPDGAGGIAGAGLPPWYATALTAGFASLFAAAGIALRGIGGEGSRMWLLRVSPLSVRQLLAAKFLAGVVVAATLGTLLLWIGEVRARVSPGAVVMPTIRLLFIIGGLVALATGMGSLRPRLDWTDSRRSVGAGTGFLFLVLGSGYLTMAFVVLGMPYALHETGALAVTLADAVLLALTSGTGAVALALGAARLRRIDV